MSNLNVPPLRDLPIEQRLPLRVLRLSAVIFLVLAVRFSLFVFWPLKIPARFFEMTC